MWDCIYRCIGVMGASIVVLAAISKLCETKIKVRFGSCEFEVTLVPTRGVHCLQRPAGWIVIGYFIKYWCILPLVIIKFHRGSRCWTNRAPICSSRTLQHPPALSTGLASTPTSGRRDRDWWAGSRRTTSNRDSLRRLSKTSFRRRRSKPPRFSRKTDLSSWPNNE